MIDVRAAESDADLEAWRRVRMAVLPNERVQTVAELRAQAVPGRLLLLATVAGELAGAGIASRSDGGGAFVQPRVMPGHRRRGVGTALLWRLAGHAEAQGHTAARAHVEEPESLAFAERFGFRERMRQLEQVRSVAPPEDAPVPPAGMRILPLAAHPELAARVFDDVAREALTDFATDRPLVVDKVTWARDWLPSTDDVFVAVEGDRVVGIAGFDVDADHPHRGEHTLTAVRRDRRGRGIARMLKQQTIHHASTRGVRQLTTWTQTGNEAMQALNRSLGYVDGAVTIDVEAPLPLREEG